MALASRFETPSIFVNIICKAECQGKIEEPNRGCWYNVPVNGLGDLGYWSVVHSLVLQRDAGSFFGSNKLGVP